MNLLENIITYVRRIIKSPSNAQITDNLIIDYINRFWLMDVDARIQLFDLKTTYQFQTTPAVDQYNMPLYTIQIEPGTQDISYYPVYQGFLSPVFINGITVPLYTEPSNFYNIWPNVVQYQQTLAVGDGGKTQFTLNVNLLSQNANPPQAPVNGLLRGHIDTTGIIAVGSNPVQDPPITASFLTGVPTANVLPQVYITSTDATGNNIVISDSGQFLSTNTNCGLLMVPGGYPEGNVGLSGTYSATNNVVNYLTGQIYVNFPTPPAAGASISVQCFYFETGLPRGILFYNNVLTLRSPPDKQYLVQLTAYLSPAAFLSTDQAVQFAYMSEYIARGAARKILADTGDVEQFQFYEPLFREQEILVWKRSQRQFTSNRTSTIFVQGSGQFGFNNMGGGSI